MHMSLRCLHEGEGRQLQSSVSQWHQCCCLGTSASGGESALKHGHWSQSGAQAAAAAAKRFCGAGKRRPLWPVLLKPFAKPRAMVPTVSPLWHGGWWGRFVEQVPAFGVLLFLCTLGCCFCGVQSRFGSSDSAALLEETSPPSPRRQKLCGPRALCRGASVSAPWSGQPWGPGLAASPASAHWPGSIQ